MSLLVKKNFFKAEKFNLSMLVILYCIYMKNMNIMAYVKSILFI